ncbi:MAG: CHAP domain-containing protein [Spirochaetaceae bacterium]|nr:MAG: CHAP domain-containing protein [Spirochaetaceae bacterium]
MMRYANRMNDNETSTLRWLHLFSVALVIVVVSAGCVTGVIDGRGDRRTASGRSGARRTEEMVLSGGERLSDVQQRIVDAAHHVEGRRNLVFEGKRFSWDCSGVILALYYLAGVDLEDEFSRYPGNGVARLYQIAKHYNLLYDTRTPAPGDVIFWDNTYDRNGDGQWNDPLSHAGVVVNVSEQGTIQYIHHNYRRGIIVESMNLYHPDRHTSDDGKRLYNAPMRMQRDRHILPEAWLASHLYRVSAMLYLLPDQSRLASGGP